MQPASSVSYYGTDFMEDIRSRRIPREIVSHAMGGAIPGYHSGGKVGHTHKDDVGAELAKSFNIFDQDIPVKPGFVFKNSSVEKKAVPYNYEKLGAGFFTPPKTSYPIDKIKSPMGSVQRFLDVAKSQIGQDHSYMYHASEDDVKGTPWGPNKFSVFANKKYGLNDDIINWCGAFIAWVAEHSGIDLSDKIFSGYQATRDYAKRGLLKDPKKDKNLKNVKPGDLLWFDFGTGMSIPEHAAISNGKPTPDGYINTIGQYKDGVGKQDFKLSNLYASVTPDFKQFAMGGAIPGYAMGGAIPGYANAGKVKPNPSAANIRKYMSLRDSINDPRTHITRSVKGDDVRRMVAENVASKYYEPGSKQHDSAVYMYENNNWAAKGYNEYWSAYQSVVNGQVLDRSKTLSRMKSHMGIKDGDYTGLSGFLAGLGLPVRAMGGAIPGYHKGGPVGHRHKFGTPSPTHSQGSWWDKVGQKSMYQSNGAYNLPGMLGYGLLDGIKSVGAVALDSLSQGMLPARKRDHLTAAEMTLVGPVARLFGSDAFPNPWGEDGLGMSSGWAKGMDIASILTAFIPGLFAAKTSTATATNAAASSVVRVAPKIKVPKTTTAMPNKYFDGDLSLDDAIGTIPKKVMPAKYSMDYDPSGGYHRITVKDGNETAGYLTWNKETGVVENLQVYDGHKGNHIGTTMYKHAQTIAPITHSPFRTPAGDAWAYTIGDPVVPLDKNWLPGDWTPRQLEAAAARAAERASAKSSAQNPGPTAGVIPHTKGVPVEFDPLYLTHLSTLGKTPFAITGGGSSARRGVTKSTNLLFKGLSESGRLDLLPTPKAFKFTRSGGHYSSIGDEIQMHLNIGTRNPDLLNLDSPTYLTNAGKAVPKNHTIGPTFPTFIHEMAHSWDLGTAGGGRSRRLFMERFSGKEPNMYMTTQQRDVYGGLKEGTADWYMHEIFPSIKDRLPASYLEQYVERLGRSYKSDPGVLTARDILEPGGKYLKADGKVAPDRIHQASKAWLEGYLDSNTHLEPRVRFALEKTLTLLDKFNVSREILENNRVAFGYGPETSMRDMLSDRLWKAFEYADIHGLAMGGSIPKFHNGGQVNTKFAGGETMALLKDKEMVFTQDQMTALGSITSTPNQSVPTSITYAPVINAAPGMDEEMLANLVMVKLGTATNIRYKANGSSGMRVIK